MKTTKSLSKAYLALQQEAMDKIKSFFNNKKFERIIVDANRFLQVDTGRARGTVKEIHKNGNIIGVVDGRSVIWESEHNELLPVDALLTILDELERMKKENQLKKP